MRPRPHRPPRPSRGGHQSVWLYGRHAVLAALANPDRKLERLLATRDVADRNATDFAGASAKAEILSREDLAQRLPAGAVHQGIAALVVPLEEPQIEDLLARCGDNALVLALDQLREAGFWLYGLDEAGDVRIGDLDLGGRACLALGAEGEGLRRLTAEKCDRLVTIPTEAKLASLNVSNAAAIAAYEWKRRRAS